MSLFSPTRSSRKKKVARSEAGIIDLASIMVGILVIGLMGAVIAATVFTVIPWAQEQAGQTGSSEAISVSGGEAYDVLTAVVEAQEAYLGLAKSSGVGEYGSLNANRELMVDGLVIFDGSDYDVSLRVVSAGQGAEAHFAASVMDSDGIFYAVTDTASIRVVESSTAMNVSKGDSDADTLANFRSVEADLK